MATAKKLPSGRWRVLVYSHTEQVDGKSVRRYESFTADTKKEAEFLAAEFSHAKERRQTPGRMTLGEAIDQYIAKCEKVLAPTTISGYRRIRRDRFKAYMDMPLKRLSPSILQQMINEETGVRSGKYKKSPAPPLSSKTIHNAYGLVSTAIHAVLPQADTTVKLPAPENKIKELIPPEVILQIIKGTNIELPCLLAMWLSLTISEIRGLTKSGSIKNGYLTINQVVVDVDGQAIVKKQAKTYTRTRKLKIPQYIQELIDKTEGDILVPRSGSAVYKAWQRLLQRNNLPPMTFHDLRHENASIMALLQIPEKYAMERGGWKTPATMKRVYTHTFSAAREAVDEKINAFFLDKMQHEMQHEE